MRDLGDLVAMRIGAQRVEELDCQSVRGEKLTKEDRFYRVTRNQQKEACCECETVRRVYLLVSALQGA